MNSATLKDKSTAVCKTSSNTRTSSLRARILTRVHELSRSRHICYKTVEIRTPAPIEHSSYRGKYRGNYKHSSHNYGLTMRVIEHNVNADLSSLQSIMCVLRQQLASMRQIN